MSSNILSRPVDVSKFGLIYAGAQKNIGPAGLTIVIVRDDLVGHADPRLPTMLDYKTHADNDSMYNTPPTYGIYIAGLVFQMLKRKGGIAQMEKTNIAKAKLLYAAIDASNGFYKCPVSDSGPLAHERAVHAEGCEPGWRLPQAGRRTRIAATQGASFGRRHARLDLQRDAAGRRAGAGQLHERIRKNACPK